MKKITEYAQVIVGGGNTYELSELVNAKIAEGFQPYGYPCVAGASGETENSKNEADFIIVQAMVKYGK
jgi:hypothetical protein